MTRGKVWRLVIIMSVLMMVFGSVPTSLAGPDDEVRDDGTRKIVVFKDRAISEADMEQVAKQTGANKIKHLPLINAMVVEGGPETHKALKGRPEVLRVDDDAVAYAQAKKPPPPPPPPAGEQLPWGVHRVGADLVWDTDHNLAVDAGANAGDGIKVAVLDTGIDLDHPDLKDNIKGNVNLIRASKSGDDDNGHGTHVAGIIASADNTVGTIGVAPKVWLYAVKVLNSKGDGYYSDIIEGLQWSVNNGMQVVNMSFAGTSDVQSFRDALIATYKANIVLVAAAGNSGPGDNTVGYPAKYPETIAVSATGQTDVLAAGSSRGPEVKLAAPGVNIYSTYKGGEYTTLSGTSMAAPHVAGAAALVIKSGVTDVENVRTKMYKTANDLGTPGLDNLYGYGLVDAQEAITGVHTTP